MNLFDDDWNKCRQCDSCTGVCALNALAKVPLYWQKLQAAYTNRYSIYNTLKEYWYCTDQASIMANFANVRIYRVDDKCDQMHMLSLLNTWHRLGKIFGRRILMYGKMKQFYSSLYPQRYWIWKLGSVLFSKIMILLCITNSTSIGSKNEILIVGPTHDTRRKSTFS